MSRMNTANKRMKRLLVTGSRDWTDDTVIEEHLHQAWQQLQSPEQPHVVLVHGGCRTGADAIADRIWRKHHLPVEVHYADWRTLGKAAGPIRNRHMAGLGADLCLAFILNQSVGASHCVQAAQAAGIPTTVIERIIHSRHNSQ